MFISKLLKDEVRKSQLQYSKTTHIKNTFKVKRKSIVNILIIVCTIGPCHSNINLK